MNPHLPHVIEPTATVAVTFHQHGEWGGRTFHGQLYWHSDPLAGLLLDHATMFRPALRVSPDQGDWSGMEFIHREQGGVSVKGFPGQFASGYDHPLAGRLFIGELHLLQPDGQFQSYSLPQSVFNLPISYLHTTLTDLTPGERELVQEACWAKGPFAAGASLQRFFSRAEFERGETVAYA